MSVESSVSESMEQGNLMVDDFPGGFAVLMAVYRRDEPGLFKKALASVFDNTLQPTEVWVVADGPITSELDEVLLHFQEAHPDLLRIVRLEENRGLAHALNAGLDRIRLPWIVRADADDYNLPHRFAALAKLLRTRPELDLMSSAILEVAPTGGKIAIRAVPETEAEIYRFARSRNPFNHMAVAYRRAKVLEVGGYPAIHLKEDYALWCLMLAKKARVGNLPEVLVHATAGLDMYRRRGGWKYARAEWVMQRLLVTCGLKSWWRAGIDGISRAAVFLAPAVVRGMIYTRLLRRRPRGNSE